MRFIVLSVVVLAACAHRQPLTPEQQAQMIVQNFGPICDQVGFARDTDAWRQCVLSRYDAAMQASAANRSAAIQAYGASQMNRPRNCTFTGNQMTCF